MLNKLQYGVARAQGSRDHQEDRYTCVDDLSTGKGPAYFAVFDGHGGDTFASHSSKNVHKLIYDSETFKDGDYSEAIREGILEEDRQLFKEHKKDKGGCTATVCLITSDKLYLGNVGDSRAVLAVDDDDGKLVAERLSRDWKPTDPDENKRIKQAGGDVTNGRVYSKTSGINMSRAIGDFKHKMPLNKADGDWIASEPYIATPVDLHPGVRFLVLASDGLWNVASDKHVVTAVNKLHKEGKTPSEIAENLTSMCAETIGSDNVTVIVVFFDYEHKEKHSRQHHDHHHVNHHDQHHRNHHDHHHKQSD